MPRLAWRSPLWSLFRLSIELTDLDGELFVSSEELAERDSRELYQGLVARMREAKTVVQQSRWERFRGRPEPAVDIMLRARDIVADSGARDLIARVLFETSLAPEAAGRLPDALTARRRAVTACEGMRAVLGGGEAAEEKFLRSKIEVYESMIGLLGRMVSAERDPGEGRRLIGEALKKGATEIEGTGSEEVDRVLARIKEAQKEITRLSQEQSEALAAGNPERAAKLGEVIARSEEDLGRLYLDIKSADPDLDARLGFFDPREIDLMDAPGNPRLVVYFVGEKSLLLWVFSAEGFLEWKEYPIGRALQPLRRRRHTGGEGHRFLHRPAPALLPGRVERPGPRGNEAGPGAGPGEGRGEGHRAQSGPV